MKLTRRYQLLPAYAYCRRHGCKWTDAGSSRQVADAVEAEAAAHVTATGHEVRVVTSREIILTPAQLQAVR